MHIRHDWPAKGDSGFAVDSLSTLPIEEASMTAKRTPGSPIPLESLPNLRDLGGWGTNDGRVVRYGMLFRSTALDKLSPDDAGSSWGRSGDFDQLRQACVHRHGEVGDHRRRRRQPRSPHRQGRPDPHRDVDPVAADRFIKPRDLRDVPTSRRSRAFRVTGPAPNDDEEVGRRPERPPPIRYHREQQPSLPERIERGW